MKSDTVILNGKPVCHHIRCDRWRVEAAVGQWVSLCRWQWEGRQTASNTHTHTHFAQAPVFTNLTQTLKEQQQDKVGGRGTYRSQEQYGHPLTTTADGRLARVRLGVSDHPGLQVVPGVSIGSVGPDPTPEASPPHQYPLPSSLPPHIPHHQQISPQLTNHSRIQSFFTYLQQDSPWSETA